MKMEGNVHGEFDLPGFRFHPTEEELLGFYLKKKVEGQQFSSDIIGTVDLYRYDPWQLPDVASVGEREWFFFVPRDKKCTAARRSRLTVSGYWKATGSDRPVRNRLFECIGLKKTLVFYRGKAPRGEKTDWIMNEYRMPDFCLTIKKELVLCRIHRKATPMKTLKKRAMAAGEEYLNASAPSNSLNFHHDYKLMNNESECTGGGLSSANIGNGEEVLRRMNTLKESKMKLPLLQVPMSCMDKLFSQAIVSPWTDNSWTPSILLCTPKEDWNTI